MKVWTKCEKCDLYEEHIGNNVCIDGCPQCDGPVTLEMGSRAPDWFKPKTLHFPGSTSSKVKHAINLDGTVKISGFVEFPAGTFAREMDLEADEVKLIDGKHYCGESDGGMPGSMQICGQDWGPGTKRWQCSDCKMRDKDAEIARLRAELGKEGAASADAINELRALLGKEDE